MFSRRSLQKGLSYLRLRHLVRLVSEIHTKSSWFAPRGSSWSGVSVETASDKFPPDRPHPNPTSTSGANTMLPSGAMLPKHVRQSGALRPLYENKLQPNKSLVGKDTMPSTVTISKQPPVKPLPQDSDEAKEIYRGLMGMEADQLLEYVNEEHERLNKIHVALAMKRLFYLRNDHTNSGDGEAFIQQVLGDQRFQVLYALVALKGPYYEAEVAADMFRFLAILGLDSNDPAVQVYLQLMKYHVNDLDLDILIRVGYSVSRMTESPQTIVLLKAIQALVSLRRKHIETLNGWQLVTLLEIFGPDLDPEVTEEVMSQLLETENEIGPTLMVILLEALGKIDKRNMVLVNMCIEALIRKVNVLNLTQVTTVLDSCNKIHLCDLELFKELGQKVIQHPDLSQKMEILDLFSHQSYFHRELLVDFKTHLFREVTGEKCFFGPSLLTVLKLLAESVTPSDLTLDNKSVLQQNLVPKDICSILTRDIERGWTGYTLGEKADVVSVLSVLDCCPRHLVLELINCDELSVDTSGNGTCEIGSIVYKLALAANTLGCVCPVRFAPVLRGEGHYEEIMMRALELTMGDKSGVLTGPLVDSGLIIDHLILLRQDKTLAVEEFVHKEEGHLTFRQLPEGTQKVAVLNFHSNRFHSNTGQMKGLHVLHGRLLQRHGYSVVVIDNGRWWKMSERDKVPYLRRNIINASKHQDLWLM